MGANPGGQRFFGDATLGKRENLCDDVSVGDFEIVSIHSKECGNREEADTLVSVAVRVVPHQSEAVRGGQGRDICALAVMPLLLRSRQG